MDRPSTTLRLSDVLDWWMELRCDCSRSLMLPCRVLATELKQDRSLWEVAAKLRCVVCVERPRSIRLLGKPPSGEDGLAMDPGTKVVQLAGSRVMR